GASASFAARETMSSRRPSVPLRLRRPSEVWCRASTRLSRRRNASSLGGAGGRALMGSEPGDGALEVRDGVELRRELRVLPAQRVQLGEPGLVVGVLALQGLLRLAQARDLAHRLVEALLHAAHEAAH